MWFFSLDVNRLLPALAARASYFLPYCWGSASHVVTPESLDTTVKRRWPHAASTSIRVSIGERIEQPDALAVFLSARWGLYSKGFGSALRYALVDHETWILYTATLEYLNDTLVVAAGLPAPQGDAHVMYSPGVSVRIGLPHSV
ncbi:unannotated protein [freshwater metagenome]|uniref:Unannotated protein n=1 Tax=freshwater metagenome TaxID=449393 RepID=A0A6J6HCQ1_9ZZZZ